MPRVVGLKVVRPGVTHIAFDTGDVREVEWKSYAKLGTLFAPLADPDYAAKGRKVHGGHAVSWPGGLDWSAGGLLKIGRVVPAGDPGSTTPRRTAIKTPA